MITYMRSKDRVDNYHLCNKLANGKLNLFKAVDGLKNYAQLCEFDRKNNFHTDFYKEKWKSMPGKLGCNLSYSVLFSKILKEDLEEDWFLILEDDAGVKKGFIEEAEVIAEKADLIGTHFVRLYVGEGQGFWPEDTGYWNFSKSQQFNEAFLIDHNFYKMIPQWHTTAQLINKEGIRRLLEIRPWNENIDLLLNSFSHLIFATAYPSESFSSKGSCGVGDDQSEMGSVIYESETFLS